MIRTIGIDLGKTTFHVIGTDEHGRILLKKRVSITQLLHLTANLVPCLIGWRLVADLTTWAVSYVRRVTMCG